MWRHYLLGRRFVLMTVHSRLRHLFDQQTLNTRKARWMALLSEFDFEIKHIRGKDNKVVNSLRGSKKMIHLVAVSTYKMDVRERVRNAQETYAFFNTMTSYLRQEPTEINYEGYQMLEERLLTYINRLYIPKCDDLKRFIMDELHKRPYTGHPGYHNMITTNRKQFDWPVLKKYIANYLAKFL
jgi:hypothetical protein